MSIYWYQCNNCGVAFPDCGDYVLCEHCGNTWCDDECAEEDGFRVDVDNDKIYNTSCNYCRNEDFEDDELLKHALVLLNMVRQELVESLKSRKDVD